MPYTKSQPVIFTWVTENVGYTSYFDHFVSNGSYLRTKGGHLIDRSRRNERRQIKLLRRSPSGLIGATITDRLLCERIETYFSLYYGKRLTNCSCFADYLFTGDFSECDMEEYLLVARHHMRNFNKGQRVSVGDMVCLMYAHDKPARSRKYGLRESYRVVQKQRHDQGPSIRRSLRDIRGLLSPEDLHEHHTGGFVNDFHFMICVAIRYGQPVWLSQMGKYRPEHTSYAPFVITIGDEDPCPDETLLMSFIKRRR